MLTQNFKNWECIIIDGLSNDTTLEIVKEYSNIDTRFSYISEKDNGVFDALNKGVKLANGEWVYVLGSDDILIKDSFEQIIELKKENSDVIYGKVLALFRDGRTREIRTKKLSFMKYLMITSHQAMLVRKKLIADFGYFNLKYKLCADFDLCQRMYLSGKTFQYININISYYGMDGLSNSYSFKNDLDHYKVCKNNKSNKFPLVFFILDEIKWTIVNIRNKILK